MNKYRVCIVNKETGVESVKIVSAKSEESARNCIDEVLYMTGKVELSDLARGESNAKHSRKLLFVLCFVFSILFIAEASMQFQDKSLLNFFSKDAGARSLVTKEASKPLMFDGWLSSDDGRQAAWRAVQEAVRLRLKSPASASFPSIEERDFAYYTDEENDVAFWSEYSAFRAGRELEHAVNALEKATRALNTMRGLDSEVVSRGLDARAEADRAGKKLELAIQEVDPNRDEMGYGVRFIDEHKSFVVRFYVDSQNSFGALIRSEIAAILKPRFFSIPTEIESNLDWEIVELQIF